MHFAFCQRIQIEPHSTIATATAGVAHLTESAAVRVSNLAHSGVGDNALAQLTLTLKKLEEEALAVPLHVAGATHLAGATALRELNLAYSGVGDDALTQLARF